MTNGAESADLTVIDEWDGGVGWFPNPDEAMERACHALAVDGDVWLLDPVDVDGLDELLSKYGAVAGVVCCLGRHKRDSAAIANRHGVSVYLPDWMTGVESDIDAPVQRFGDTLADTDIRAIQVRNSSIPPWQEVALYADPDHHSPALAGTLYVPESVGTGSFFSTEPGTLGVHPVVRLFPPKDALSGLRPERVLVGHGEGIMSDGDRALRNALDGSRRNAPAIYVNTLKHLISG